MDLLRKLWLTGAFIAIFIYPMISSAQLSPGDLSESHASVEGIENCGKCHGFDQKLSPEKCFACHIYLGERVKAGLGMHAGADYSKCENCHVEHQGQDFDLVYWKESREKFNHSLTGFKLDGKHATTDCRACHKEQNLTAKDRLLTQKVDLARTYLGLSQDCLSCHQDEHRGQLAKTCLNCHVMAAWKPASAFKHDSAKFTLAGKHFQVACAKCHPTIVDNKSDKDRDYLKFAGLNFSRCLDCHQDAHNNKLGQNCEGCHTPADWHNVTRGKFDHAKTQFPLDGRHASVPCEKCHQPGKSFKGVKFDKCLDCHRDYHQGQFAARPARGACEECHTVAGFSPAKFTVEQHQATKYPLAGSHLAIPCISCHSEIMSPDSVEMIRFKFDNTRCNGCHQDPHKGQVDKYISRGGCEYCHIVDSWRKTSFDHSQTKLPLEGKHKEIACRPCHRESQESGAPLKFANLPSACNGCHEDIHRGQFALISQANSEGSKNTDCSRCHSPAAWKELKFDHNRDSSFKLDGAHLKVGCRGCHKEISGDGKPYFLFKPLNSACSSCHGGKSIQNSGGGKS